MLNMWKSWTQMVLVILPAFGSTQNPKAGQNKQHRVSKYEKVAIFGVWDDRDSMGLVKNMGLCLYIKIKTFYLFCIKCQATLGMPQCF